MSNEFRATAHRILIPSAAVAEVLVMARDHAIDLNSCEVKECACPKSFTVTVGEVKTGNFIIVTMSPIMTTVGRYAKQGFKTVCVNTKSF